MPVSGKTFGLYYATLPCPKATLFFADHPISYPSYTIYRNSFIHIFYKTHQINISIIYLFIFLPFNFIQQIYHFIFLISWQCPSLKCFARQFLQIIHNTGISIFFYLLTCNSTQLHTSFFRTLINNPIYSRKGNNVNTRLLLP